jgi:hypothetical protein
MDKLKTGKQKIKARWNMALNLWEVGYFNSNTTFRVIFTSEHLPSVDLVSA